MTHAELTVTFPDGTWIGDVSRTHPEAAFRVLAAIPGEDAGFGLVEISTPDVRSVLADVETHEAMNRVELLRAGAESAVVQFETARPRLLFSARESRIPLELPLDVVDRTTTISVTAPREQLSELGRQLEVHGLEYDVEYVGRHSGPERVLTDRQREVIRTAIELGYYDTPREISMTELAGVLGVAKSTCSETLHRAEETIVKRYAGEELPELERQAVEP